jgi:hypothetical protein
MSDAEGTFTSQLVRATRRSSSLRTTVPQVIAELLDLQPGDAIVWTIDPAGDHARIGRAPREAPETHRPATPQDEVWVSEARVGLPERPSRERVARPAE